MSAESFLEFLSQDLTIGNLQVRLAETPEEIDAAQALRYRVFYEERGAIPDEETKASKRDADRLDEFCEHLLVVDNDKEGADKIVGTYRLIRREHAEKYGSFYSESEFDITPLKDYPGEILELGRSCIDKEYRSGTVMQTLWKGLAAYMFQYDIKLMFGCASLHGSDPEEHKIALSYLYHHHLAPPALRAASLPQHYTKMDILPKEAFDPEAALDDLDFNSIRVTPREGKASLPPLLKGYLRVGAYVGDGAFVDKQFNTTDVMIIVKTEMITGRYLRHYERMKEKEGE